MSDTDLVILNPGTLVFHSFYFLQDRCRIGGWSKKLVARHTYLIKEIWEMGLLGRRNGRDVPRPCSYCQPESWRTS